MDWLADRQPRTGAGKTLMPKRHRAGPGTSRDLSRISEEVSSGLDDGSFGMVEETGVFLNRAASMAASEGLGLGETVGREIAASRLEFAAESIFACAYEAGIPATIHVTLGADIIHM